MPRRLFIPAVVVALLLAAGILLDALDGVGLISGCPLHRFTGLYCAGCGGTRAIHALLHGDLVGSFRMNALLMPFLLLVVLLCFKPRLMRNPVFLIGVPAVIVLFAVLRNLSLFHFLAPH